MPLPELESDEVLQDILLNLKQDPNKKWYLIKEKDSSEKITVENIGKRVLQEDTKGLRYLDGTGEGTWNGDKSRIMLKDCEKKVLTREEETITVGGRQILVRSLVVATEQVGGAKDVRYKSFIAKMKDAKAMPLVRSIKRFISTIGMEAQEKGSGDREFQAALPNRVSSFLDDIFKELQLNSLWAEASDEELTHAKEGMEKYVLCKVHPHIFGRAEDVYSRDQEIQRKFREYDANPSPHVLPVTNACNHPRWHEAIQQLQAVNDYKSPFDKLICMSNCCRIVNLVSMGKMPAEDNINESVLTNGLLHLIQQAKAPLLVSNITYITQYHEKDKLAHGENAVFLRCMQSAVDRWLDFSMHCLQLALLLPGVTHASLPSMDLPSASHIPLNTIATLVEHTKVLRKMEQDLREKVGLPAN
eukprot:TRINITY_DN10307_c0_g1_i1.p1 TRINITY_DN10307_c0_g1~~TRINITY_DN10307_c0_g1_i1.p1  ORF type:complete len:416 (+),score=97.98 TRINITY_DN10307_c0_g1_i1:62-1309(+)